MSRVICITRDSKSLVAGLFKSAGSGEVVLKAIALADAEGAQSMAGIYKNFGERSVHVALPMHETLIKIVRTVKVKASDWPRVAEFEAEQAIPGGFEGSSWDWMARETEDELELLFAAAKNTTVARWCDLVELQRLNIETIAPMAMAGVNGFRYNYPEEQAGLWLICFGERSTQLIWIDGAVVYVRALPRATLMSHADSPNDEAKRLAGEIARTTMADAFPGKTKSAGKVFLAGALYESSDFARTLGDSLHLPVERVDAFRKVRSKVDLTVIAREHEIAWLGLVGMAAQTSARSVRLNLLPRERRDMRSWWRKRFWLAAAAALVLLASTVPVVAVFKNVRQLEDRKGALDGALLPLRSLENGYTRELAAVGEAQKIQAAWKNWIKQKSAWSGFLAELQECLWRTEDAWLDRLQTERAVVQGRTVVRVELRGRWVDASRPLAKNTTAGRERMGLLFEELALCKGVIAVEDERFEAGGNGVLNFSCRILIEEGEMI